MPIEITPAGPENIPNTVFPEGHVDAANNPAEPPLQHRPHAFALMYGDGGAKVAYGQLLYKIDILTLNYVDLGSGIGFANNGAGQDSIGKLYTCVPTIDTSGGAAMDPTVPNEYHQLDGFGDVYLNWTVSLDEDGSDHVTACWVSTTAGDQTDVPALDVGNTASDFDSRGSNAAGAYRVKLGTVNEDARITQLISSDVHWNIFALERTRV